MAGSKPLVRQGGRTQQGNISIESVTGLSSELGAKVDNDDSRLTDSREWTASTVLQEEAEAGTATTARKWTAQRVAQAIGSLGLKIGTTSTTAAAGNDSRLSDSREWTASTISQAEAEAGTATTRRAWTAQRVRQAVVAAWNALSSAWGRGFVNSADAGVARTTLGLGTAATRDVGGSSGNVMEVGAGGLLTISTRTFSSPTDTNNTAGFYRGYKAGATTTEGWPADTAHLDYASVVIGNLENTRSVLFFNTRTAQAYLYCKRANIYDGWVEFLSNKNLLTTTGQSTEYPMTQKAVTDALNAKSGLGVGQTWQEVTYQRYHGTTYTNSTGKPIQIMIQYDGYSGNTGAIFYIGSLSIKTNTTSDGGHWFSAIIPNGVTYRFEGANVSLHAWWELI